MKRMCNSGVHTNLGFFAERPREGRPATLTSFILERAPPSAAAVVACAFVASRSVLWVEFAPASAPRLVLGSSSSRGERAGGSSSRLPPGIVCE